MPDLTNMQQMQTASSFHFSAVGLDALGATEYTLATVVVDISGSVSGWERNLESCLKAIVKSCKKSPRSDNLMLRVTKFNDNVVEVHAFKELNTIKDGDYDNSLNPSGGTALCDAVLEAVEATKTYGQLLSDQNYQTNSVIYVVTDGADNTSHVATPNSLKTAVGSVKREEKLESMAVILIGVGYGGSAQYLDSFKNQTNITQFVDLEELFRKTSPEGALAKLAGYVSKSISSTSQALGTGNSVPTSSVLTF